MWVKMMENIFGKIVQDAQMVKIKSGPQNWIQIRVPTQLKDIYYGVEEGKLNSEMSLMVRCRSQTTPFAFFMFLGHF